MHLTLRNPKLRPSHSRVAICVLLVVLGIVAAPRAGAQANEEQEASYFHAGQAALKQGDLPQAAKEFKKVLDLDPNLVEARVNLGLIYHALGDYNQAAGNLSVALAQRPNLAGPTVVLGIDYLKLGQVDKAIPVLQRGLSLDPSSLEAHEALAKCYLARADYRQTVVEYREQARLNPDQAEAWFKLGHDYLNLAARLAFRGSHLYLDSPWGHRFLGDTLFQRERWRDAAEEYQKALDLDPAVPGLHTALGKAYLMAGKTSEAEGEFQHELQRDPQSEGAWLELAETRLMKGQAIAALEAVDKTWQISPEYLALPRKFPAVVISKDAVQSLLKDLEAAPASPSRDFLLANLHLYAGDPAEAEEPWKSFQAAFQAWLKGAGAGQGGDPCAAHRYVECAQGLETRKPLSRPQILLLGRTLYTLQQYDRAADTLARLLEPADKSSAEASYWLSLAYQALGAAAYDRLEESFPDSWRMAELRAEGYALRNKTNEALEEFQKALELHPDGAELHEARGELLLSKRSYNEAQAELEASLRLDPSRPHTLALLGRLYVLKRENEKAVPYLENSLRYEPDMPDANDLLGTAYVRLGQDAKALPLLQKAVSIDFYGDIHYQMYVAYRRLGKTELAQQALARSQELRRNSAAEHQAMVSGVEKVE